MERKYCENCENFSNEESCYFCGMEFIEPEWSKQRAKEMAESISNDVNCKLTP